MENNEVLQPFRLKLRGDWGASRATMSNGGGAGPQGVLEVTRGEPIALDAGVKRKLLVLDREAFLEKLLGPTWENSPTEFSCYLLLFSIIFLLFS